MRAASPSRFARGILTLGALLLALLVLPAASHADPCTAPVASPVACENTKPGVPESEWRVAGNGDPSIQGFATRMSVDKGRSISLKIKSSTADYHVDVLRLGYYDDDGARMVDANLQPTSTQAQPPCTTETGTGLIDCGSWAVSLTWAVPSSAVSGLYIARLVRNDTGGASRIAFVVRDDAAHADVVLQTADATWTAYNTFGGNNLYQCQASCPPGNPLGYRGAAKVSYNKPLTLQGMEGPFWSEYPLIRFMEANGYDITYVSEVDVHADPGLLLDHKLFISSGHDEYWSNTQRRHVEQARDAGVNLAFFGGNDIFWKTRWEPSIDAGATPDRTLVSYKDTHFDAPTDPVEWTGTWRDPRFSPPGDGGRPENALMGQAFLVNSGTSDIQVPSQFRQLRAWRNTDVAALGPGQKLTLARTSLGYEWDVDFDNEFRPPGTFHLSSTTVDAPEVFVDYGSQAAPRTQTHTMTLYRAPSGARVFSTGTVNWARGLDNSSSRNIPMDRNMQQMTVNVFADDGVQPQTPIAGIVPGSPSTDDTAPLSTITSPPAEVFPDGAIVTISGTATDAGGGAVAGVEVSADGGTTWHPTTGTTSWSYDWTVHGAPSVALRSRAVDDSANLEAPGPGVTVDVSCPCSILGLAEPLTRDAGDANAAELGVKFQSSTAGSVEGIRFYKSSLNTGTHTGSLWAATGTRLAQATFTDESDSGWQTVTFATPVAIAANTTYIASYHAPNGHFAVTRDAMHRPPAPTPTVVADIDSSPLHALANSTSPNGVFVYTPTSAFPTNTFRANNYWVDVSFTSGPIAKPGRVTNVSATARSGSASLSWSAPATGGAATTYTITPSIGATAQTPVTVSGAPAATTKVVPGLTPGTGYTFTVQASNVSGAGPESAPSNAIAPLSFTAPSAPTGILANAASASAQVTWSTPADDGGQPISGYTIRPYIGTDAQPATQAPASATSATIAGLTNATAYTFTVTATNSVGTSPEPAASSAVTPRSTRSIFGLATPVTADSGDNAPIEVGLKFQTDTPGSVTGIRFYKSASNTGTHTGSLWTSTGTRLAQATFTDEGGSGWQAVAFATPVAIAPDTTYVASYYAPRGHYSVTSTGLTAAIHNPPLHTLAGSTSANGVYAYAPASAFPASTFHASNYWVDVSFAPQTPGPVTNLTATATQGGASLSWSAPATGGAAATYTIAPSIAATAQTPVTVSGSPPATTKSLSGLTPGTGYTFTVQASNVTGAGPESAPSNTIAPLSFNVPSAPTAVLASPANASAQVTWTTPSGDGGQPIGGYTIRPYIGTNGQPATQAPASATSATIAGLTNATTYTFTVTATNSVGTSPESAASGAVTPRVPRSIFGLATPAVVDAGDNAPVELGVKFQADTAGFVTGIRFFKSSANTGTHAGSLWTSTGTRLAQATFTDETTSGWQAVTFASPVAIAANTTYVASYYAPRSHYSATTSGLSAAVGNPPLRALATSTSANGVYAYGPASAFPANTFRATNYWVDVTFVSGS